jgi:class 3 adenylate cyclase/tetratricopeptide (TPR) repeat protein
MGCPACGATNEPDELFCGECGSQLTGEVAPARQAHAPGTGVERRVVSVLFADLVGFTTLAEGRDAEDVRDLLSRYFEIARGVVERYGGVVEKFIGDAVMAVWGTPTAREDDAERAVRAGLELVAAVSALGQELRAPELAARAGVQTGEAAVTLGAEGQGMVAGDIVNSASRVQGIAEPGGVVVGESTRRASDAAIAYEDAGIHELKGREEPAQLWRALRVTAARGGAVRWEGIEPPFVGRDRELRLVKELFHASADETKAHLVSVVGIAGIGKSRLAWELYKYADGLAQTVRWRQGRCPAYGEGVTFWPLAEMVRMHVGIAEGEKPESARAKLSDSLTRDVEDADERAWIEPRLAHLVGLEERQGVEVPDLFAGWRLFLERIAERDPVVLVFEDLQWADRPLLDFVEHLLEWSRNHAIFVLALARPELSSRHPTWTARARSSTTLSLEPLSATAMEELLEGFVPGLPGEVRERILDSAEGVPLYAVEIVRMLLDRGLIEPHGDGYRLTGTLDSLEVPETLHALIASRLDGLAPAERALLQDASILGKTFTRSALITLSGTADTELEATLESLVRKQVLSLQADPRSPERGQYGFLQDLLRQVAYETLSRKERKTRHLAAAAYLEGEWLDGEPDLVEIVASHYLSALELDPDAADVGEIRTSARTMLVEAGEWASSLAASESAQRYFEGALGLTGDAAGAAELHERAGRMAMRSARTAEARAHFEQAINAFDALDRPHDAARVSAALGTLTYVQEGDIVRATTELERAYEVLSAEEEPSAELAALCAQLARTLLFSGREEEAIARNELALEIAEALDVPEVLSHGLNTKALVLMNHGRYQESGVLLRKALEVALVHDLSDAAVRAYQNLDGLASELDRYREGREWGQAQAELAQRVGDRHTAHFRLALSVWDKSWFGEWDDALRISAGIEEEADSFPPALAALILTGPTAILAARGQVAEARRRLDAARDHFDWNDVQDRSAFKATDAHVLLAEGRFEEALASAEEAVSNARAEFGPNQVFVKWGLESALEAALALGDEQKTDELLAIVEAVPPGHATPWLRLLLARFGAHRATRQGDSATALAGFEAAVALFREMEIPFETAKVLLEQAEWLASEGRVDEARACASEARATFERLEATPWLERVDRLRLDTPQPAEIPA